MITLPSSIATMIANRDLFPVQQIVVVFPGGFTKRIANVAHTFGGDSYTAELKSDVDYEITSGGKFNNLKFSVNNLDRVWGDLLISYTVPEITESDVYFYETFITIATGVPLADRILRFQGKLDLPLDLTRGVISLSSTQILNSVMEPINKIAFSPGCQWAMHGMFGDTDVCPFNPPTTGKSGTLSSGVDAVTTQFNIGSASSYYKAGEYAKVDNEIVLISSVESAHIHVTRAQKDTTAATHSAAARVNPYTCIGSYASCKCKGMEYRFGGLVKFPRSGTYYWREKIILGLSRKITKTWKSQDNVGIFDSPWGIVYGHTEIVTTPLYVRDPGSFAVFFASCGIGPHLGPQGSPSYRPNIKINGVAYNSYGYHRGFNGQTGTDVYGEPENQRIDALWCNDPTTSPRTCTIDEGQNFSRMSYFAGAFPSDVKTEEGYPEVRTDIMGLQFTMYNHDGSVAWFGYQDDPAMIAVDILTNKLYGAGLSTDNIDFASMVAAKLAFEAEGRTFNIHITDTMAVVDFLQILCNSCLAIPTYSSNKIGLKVLRKGMAETGLTFGDDEILHGSVKFWGKGDLDRDGNYLKFTIKSQEHDWQEVPIIFNDLAHQAALGGRKRSISKKIDGITSVAQATVVGAFWLNLSKMARRQDGVKVVKCGPKGYALEPGDIIRLNTTTIDGLSTQPYMIWQVKRQGIKTFEFTCIRWDDGLFDIDGVDYDIPETFMDPSQLPVNIENLTASVSEIDEDHCQLTLSWTWPEGSGIHPAPQKVFFFGGNLTDGLENYESWTPQGIEKPGTSYTRIFRKNWQVLRVFAVSQSVWGRPEKPKPSYKDDPVNASFLSAAIDDGEYLLSVADISALNIVPGDYVRLPVYSNYEILRVASIDEPNDQFQVDNNATDRLPYFGTTAQPWPLDQPIAKLAFGCPYVDVVIVGHVQPLPYLRVYDSTTDPTLAKNQLRFIFPRDASLGDKPKVLHFQLNETLPFTDATASPSGTLDGYLEKTFGASFLVPESYDLSGAVGKLLILYDPDGEKMGRYVSSVDAGVSFNGLTWKRINLNGYMPRMMGFYSWAIWTLWYLDNTYASQIFLTDQNLSLAGNLYDVVATVELNFTGYSRGYLLTEASISDPVIGTDEADVDFLIHLIGTTDHAAPGAPEDIVAFRSGSDMVVRWNEPSSNIATLKRYLVRLSLSEYVDDGDGTYSMQNYTEVAVAPGQTEVRIPLEEPGRYSVGVVAENDFGEGEIGILWFY